MKSNNSILTNRVMLAYDESNEWIDGKGKPNQGHWQFNAVLFREKVDAIAADLHESVKLMLDAMEMQEQREIGAFHLSQPAARSLWDRAKTFGRVALQDTATVEDRALSEVASIAS